MSIDQYKDKNRAELWEIVKIQAQDSIEQNKRIAELLMYKKKFRAMEDAYVDLFHKRDVAYELSVRDKRIAELEKEREFVPLDNEWVSVKEVDIERMVRHIAALEAQAKALKEQADD